MKTTFLFSSLLLPVLRAIIFLSLFTSCDSSNKNTVRTISGDLSCKNLFTVQETLIINEQTTPASLFKDMRDLVHSPHHACGVYLQKQGDNTRIKHLFPLMGIYEDIPENNEVYWQGIAVTVPRNMPHLNIPVENALYPERNVSIGSKQRLSSDKKPSQPSKENNLSSFSDTRESTCYHIKGYVIIPLIIKDGQCFLDNEKIDVKRIGEKFPGEKICITFHFINNKDSLSRYWELMKECAEISQGRFQMSLSETVHPQ